MPIINKRKDNLNGVPVEIWQYECLCCGSILDVYYHDSVKSAIMGALKIEVIKEGNKNARK